MRVEATQDLSCESLSGQGCHSTVRAVQESLTARTVIDLVGQLVGRAETASIVNEVQLIHVHSVGSLLVIAVHLVIQGDSPPSGGGEWGVGPVEGVGLAIQRDRLVKQLIVGSA